MSRFPEPREGLVFRYRYLRIWQYMRGEQVGKERPCCILLPLKPGQVIAASAVYDEAHGSVSKRHEARAGDVMIVLIQSDPPAADQIGIELSLADKRYIGLPADKPSYVILSEMNVDRWPNADLAPVPGRDTFAYDRPLPGPTLSRMVKAFLKVQELRKAKVLIRHP